MTEYDYLQNVKMTAEENMRRRHLKAQDVQFCKRNRCRTG